MEEVRIGVVVYFMGVEYYDVLDCFGLFGYFDCFVDLFLVLIEQYVVVVVVEDVCYVSWGVGLVDFYCVGFDFLCGEVGVELFWLVVI